MPVYFEIKDRETGPTLTVTADETKQILDSMAENCIAHDMDEKYSFKAVEMSEKEFKALPDFTGF